MHPETMLAIISQLKEQRALEFPERFESRWDEIKGITLMNVVQNKMKQRK